MTQTDSRRTLFLDWLYDQPQEADSARFSSSATSGQGEVPVWTDLTQILAADGLVPLHESLTTTTGPIWASWPA